MQDVDVRILLGYILAANNAKANIFFSFGIYCMDDSYFEERNEVGFELPCEADRN